MTLYRIQDAQGRGPWRPGFSVQWIDMDKDDSLCPPMMVDFPQWRKIVARAQSRGLMHFGMAVRGIHGLHRWFTPDEIQRLRGFGGNTPTIAAFREWRAKAGGPDIIGGAEQAAYTIALAVARCIRPGSPLEPYLASLVDPDVRAIWTPTNDGYFARLPVGALDRIWMELVPSDLARIGAWAKLKKAQKAQDLHDLFNSADYREALGLSRDTTATIDAWLPKELQWPEIEGEDDEAEAA